MSATLLSLANEALLRRRFDRAIRLYVEILRRQPALSGHAAFNLTLARRRWRAARRGKRPNVGVFAFTAPDPAILQRAQALADRYAGFARVDIVGPEGVGDSADAKARPVHAIRAAHLREFLPRALEFALSRPFDAVHLCGPGFPNVVLGALYKILWDSRVIVDLGGAPAQDLFADPDGEMTRRAFEHHRFFDGSTTPDDASSNTLRAMALADGAPGGDGADDPHLQLVAQLGGWKAFRFASSPARPGGLAADGRRIVVYSVLVGAYETVKEPAALDPAARYILFTDNPDLRSEKWEIVRFDTMGLSPRRAARLPKLLPQSYLPPHDVSLYLDASLTLVEHDIAALAEACLQGCDIAAYPHYARDCAYAEIEECVRLDKADRALAEAFSERLRAEGFPRHYGLLENAFLVRRDTPVSRRINVLWLREFLTGAERDQFSLMYTLWRTGVPHAVIPDALDFRQSPSVLFTRHIDSGAPERSAPGVARSGAPAVLKELDPAALEAQCAKTLATAADAGALLIKARDDRKDRLKSSPFKKLLSAIADLEAQNPDAGRPYRDELGARLFPASARPAADAAGRIKVGYLANASAAELAADPVRAGKIWEALARSGAETVLYADDAHAAPAALRAACRAHGVALRSPAAAQPRTEQNQNHLHYLLLRQALTNGCTHIYARSLDMAVLAAVAGARTILELRGPVPASQLCKLEFLIRSPAFEKIVVTNRKLVDRLKSVLRGLEYRIAVLDDRPDSAAGIAPLFDLDRASGATAPLGRRYTANARPVINWVIGGAPSAGWAYENNAKRIIAQLPEYEHRIDSDEYSDCAVYFDAIIHSKLRKPSRASMLRLGGPNPLKRVYGTTPEEVSKGLSQFDAIIALSDQLREIASGSGAAVIVTPNGIDLSAYRPRPDAGPAAAGGPFVVGFAGNCKSEMERNFKGIEFAEQGAKLAGAEFYALKKVENQIPHDRMVPDFYHRIDCLVHPVAPGKEGSSNVIMEALACGVPVITTRHAGYHAETLTDGENVLFCERDAEDIRDRIESLRQDEALRRRLSVNGRKFAEQNHDLAQVARAYERAFAVTLGQRDEREAEDALNIALITRSFWPKCAGMELMVHNLAETLRTMGERIVLFAGEHRGPYKEIEHNYILCRYRRTFEGLREAFARHHRERPFDVIYVQGAHITAGFVLKLKQEFGVPVVLRTHGDDIQIDPSMNYGLRMDPEIDREIRHNLNHVDVNVAIGGHILEDVKTLAPNTRAALIHNGVDTARFASGRTRWLHRRLGLPDDTKILLMAGRNVKKKTMHFAVQALARIKRHYPNVVLVHAGKEGDGRNLREEARAFGVSDAFFQLGEIDYFSMPTIYAASDIFVFPAKAETFGNVTIEAMASGLPCVEFDYIVNRDKIVHGQTGYVVDHGDVEAMARAILELLTDEEKHAAFSRESRRRIGQTFAWPIIAGKYREIFRELSPRPGAAGKAGLRIAIAVDKFVNIKGGGGEKSLADLANAMAERGHEVFVVIKEAGAARGQKPFYPLDPRVRLHNIFGWPDEPAKAGKTGSREALLGAAIREIAPDIVVGFFLPEFGYIAEGVRDIDVPLVLSHRNDPQQKMADLAQRYPKRLDSTHYSYERCQLMTVQMAPYTAMLPGDAQARTVVIPNAVEPAEETMLAAPDTDAKINAILNVARLASAKNQALLIRAFAKLADRYPDWEVKIYGDGPLEAEIRALIAELGMQDRIRLMGTVSDIQPAYRDAKIFAFPSLYEGFSRALSEAMAHQLPSICVDSCICSRDFITASGGGALCTDDVDSYAEALETLIRDPQLRGELGRKARAFIAQFDRESVFDLWERHLLDVVSAARGTQRNDAHTPATPGAPTGRPEQATGTTGL